MLFEANIDSRIDELSEASAFQNYLYVRERVLEMKRRELSRASSTGAPSGYWMEELAGFEYMLDASPLIVEKLRHHTFHVTGLRVYDYRTHKDKYAKQLRTKLDALLDLAGGSELLVPEAKELGGFGFDFDEELYNLDTLKYFESLIALDLGAVLSEFRASSERKVVWEIGAGWGGLAYQFKRICSNVTYVISDFPELFLFSAVYLMTLFPEAKVRFYGEVPDGDEMDGWDEFDFIFLPHTRVDLVSPPSLDLTLNTVSFQEMTTEQVDEYVSHAWAQGCPFIYSLNRERSLYNPELSGVTKILEQRYWPHQIEVLPVSYVHMLDKVKPVTRAKRAKLRAKHLSMGNTPVTADLDYKHVIGWRRVRV